MSGISLQPGRAGIRRLALVVAVLAVASCEGDGAGDETRGRVEIVYENDSIEPENRDAFELIRDSGALERVADWTNEAMVLRKDIEIRVTDDLPAGVPAGPVTRGLKIFMPASWLTFTHELLENFVKLVRREGDPEEAFPKGTFNADDLTVGANEYTIAHEMGHALVYQLDLPMPGNEEAAVDGFAAFLTVNDEESGPLTALGIAALFDELARMQGDPTVEEFAADVPLLHQRVYNFICYVVGSDPKRWRGPLVGEGALPESRAPECRLDWAQANYGWWTILEPHFTEEFRAETVDAREAALDELREAFAARLEEVREG